ncbi:Ppx/GppA family phosphatase [Methanoculleus sp. FWC-SCC1]|uniref:Ppx/GppA family phosphatase n=1 Tax=Methanoculleus frigidifontis TaxID=2584085 RepID=A0ABT8MAB2_9EURY|nr:Ppx/GppA phosphatase family protein [Methanoculleus sp. FWC-SCC1]MDN7024878.1 Ppx/GppA family phosphatase [Methanoculleus sp. FWC-SCC1]
MADRAVEKIVAFIDLGTNSIRILVVRLNPNSSYTILTKQKELVRLGDGEFEHGKLLPEAIERTVTVCRKFAELARSFGASEIVAFATSATREAKNRSELLRRLVEEAGIEFGVISGREEARLIYLGVSSGIDLGDQSMLFIDIGGGSTEVGVGDRHRYRILESLKAGAIRMTNLFTSGSESGVVPPENYQEIQRHIRSEGIHAMGRLKGARFDLAYGCSGTIQTLADTTRLLYHPEKAEDNFVLTHTDLQQTVAYLCSLPLEKRRRVPGMVAERADIIIGGAAILDVLMEELAIPGIRISDRSLRDGMLVDYLSRMDGFPHAEPLSVRKRSVIQLGRSCGIDEAHALTVTRLALELFDSAADQKLHTCGAWEREMLEYAAYLHDIGSFISFKGHQIHSQYIIRNADLLGFDQRETGVLALIARYHRKRVPGKKDVLITSFGNRARRAVRVLSALLRYAEHLDRTHAGLVQHARFVNAQNGVVCLQIQCRGDCALEYWAVQSDTGAFKKTFGKSLTVECIQSREP